MDAMLVVDGSTGEGGGQLLRYSVALAALLNRPVRVYNIRAKRSNPGLRPQHLAAVRIIASLVSAETRGLQEGSTELVIVPRSRPRAGEVDVDIGTAGSVSLLLQAALPVLIASDGEVRMRVRGGTNVRWAPPIQYMQLVLLPLLRKFGVKAELRLVRMGFYPQGGGLVEVSARPSYPLRPIELTELGELKEINVVSYASNLPRHVAERQAASAVEYLRREGFGRYLGEVNVDTDTPAVGTGSGVVAWAVSENSVVGGDSLGERGKRAEVVGREAAEKLVSSLRTGASVDPHALDNIIIYMSLAAGASTVTAGEMTSHAETAMWLCNLMTGARFESLRRDGLTLIRAEGIGLGAGRV